MDAASGKDHFLVGSDVLCGSVFDQLDADATCTLEIQFHDVGVEQEREVWSRQRRAQKSANCAHTSPIRGDVHVDISRAWEHRSVYVIQNWHANFAGCFEEG